MNILYLRNTRGYHIDVLEVLEKRGHVTDVIEIPDEETSLLKQLAEDKNGNLLLRFGEGKYDFVFSLDYYPCISMLCENLKKCYVSWCLEPPFSNLYSSTIVNSVNTVFTADKWLAESFQQEGIQNIFYLPEGVNLDRCNRVKESLVKDREEIECSVIGDMKILSWQDLLQTEHLLDATLGYLEGMLASQNLVYGCDLFAGGLPDYLYKDLMNNSKLCLRADSVQSIQQFYAEQCFYPRTTMVDRTIATKVLTKSAKVNLYTDDTEFQFDGVKNCGKIPYEKNLEVIGASLINVSISPRGLRDGLYGHSLQIMGMGGFLITDYKYALQQEFVPREDIVIYEDMRDLAEQVKYYLENSEERERMAQRAYEKVRSNHTLEQRIEVIEKVVGNEFGK